MEEVRRQVGETIYARDVSTFATTHEYFITFSHQMVDDAKYYLDANFGLQALIKVLEWCACRKLIKCLLPSRGSHWTWCSSGQRGTGSCLLQRYLLHILLGRKEKSSKFHLFQLYFFLRSCLNNLCLPFSRPWILD